MGLLAFTTTLREGMETVIFLTGVSAGLDPRSIPLAGLVGVLLGIAVGVALFYTCVPSGPCSPAPRAPSPTGSAPAVSPAPVLRCEWACVSACAWVL